MHPLQLTFERLAKELAAVGELRPTRDSTARRIRKLSSSRSSLMYVSARPRLARKSGGWAM